MSKTSKPRLGRGLSSLLSLSEPDEAEEFATPVPALEPPPSAPTSHGPMVIDLPIEAIVPNPHQPRRQFDEASIKELAESLRSTGLIQPIIVRRSGEGYELIAGERRLRAAKAAGLATLPAIVREVDEFTQAQMALVENIQREDLNPMDRANAYQSLMQQLGLTQAELAGRLGVDRSSVAHYLRLLDLAERVQDLVRAGKLSVGHAKVLGSVTDAAKQEQLAERVVSQNLSVRNLEQLVAGFGAPPAVPATTSATRASAHLQDLEQKFSRHLGMRVQVKTAGANPRKGKVIIHYATLDQFDELKDRLGVAIE